MRKGVEEGIEKRLQKGILKGQKEQKLAIAKEMLKQNINIDMIVKLTKLSEKEIKKLLNHK